MLIKDIIPSAKRVELQQGEDEMRNPAERFARETELT
jgi:hypothetical protein